MTIQSYFYLIASSLASGLIAFGYYAPEQVLESDSVPNSSVETTATNIPADQINPECSETTINQMSAFNVQPELMLDWGFPARIVSAASR